MTKILTRDELDHARRLRTTDSLGPRALRALNETAARIDQKLTRLETRRARTRDEEAPTIRHTLGVFDPGVYELETDPEDGRVTLIRVLPAENLIEKTGDARAAFRDAALRQLGVIGVPHHRTVAAFQEAADKLWGRQGR